MLAATSVLVNDLFNAYTSLLYRFETLWYYWLNNQQVHFIDPLKNQMVVVDVDEQWYRDRFPQKPKID